MPADQRGPLTYLHAFGLVDPEVLGSRRADVDDLSRSHSVSLVALPDGRRLIVKAARPRPGEVTGNLERELAAYGLARTCPELAAAMPECLVLDTACQVLVLRAVDPGETLHGAAHRRSDLSPERAGKLAQLIAGWQQATSAPPPRTLPDDEPWVLGILTPGRWRPVVADTLLVHGVVRRELRGRFAELSGLLEPSCLVHGDLKWDNCLIDGDSGVRVVDWETAAVGDPAWDVAAIVHEYAVIRHRALLTNGNEASMRTQQSLHAFRDAYRTAWPDEGDAVFERALAFSGARLVQTALEWADAGVEENSSRALLDDALDALRRPERVLEPTSA
jgi:Phosphotransferase enzyme family